MKLAFLVLSFASSMAFAGIQNLTHFVCTTSKIIEGKTKTQFSFVVQNLGSTNGKVNYWTTSEDDYEPVKMVPIDSVLMLNDNWVISSGSKALRLTSDGDGCQFTTVMLFKNTYYQSGYARVEDGGCGATGVPLYTTVSCKLSSK